MSSDSAKGKIIYQKKHGKEYAIFQGKSIRYSDCKGPKKELEIYLGRPIDKEHLAFYSKEDGLFIFDLEKCKKLKHPSLSHETFIENYDRAASIWNDLKKRLHCLNTQNEQINFDDNTLDLFADSFRTGQIKNLNFGTTFFLISLINEIEYYKKVLSSISCVNYDNLLSLIIFKLGTCDSYSNAIFWYKSDIASFLLPRSNLSSQNISRILTELGSAGTSENYLQRHLNYLNNIFKTNKISFYIDSTAIDNEITICFSRSYYHGKKRHHGFRIITAVHIPTGLPLYYEVIHGNIIDQTTIDRIIEVLSLMGCKVIHIAGDAAYSNIKCLENLLFIDSISSFTTRFNSNIKIFSDKIKEKLENFDENCETFKYNNRIVRGRKFYIDTEDSNNSSNFKRIFIYVYKDEKSKRIKTTNLERCKEYQKMTVEEIKKEIDKYGVFSVISTRDLSLVRALSEYYARMNIEQYFDIIKNDLDILPIRSHNFETVQGNILLTFISSFFYILIKNRLKLLDEEYINISPSYSDENIFECDPVNSKNDIIKQTIIPKLVSVPLRSIFNEMKGMRSLVFQRFTEEEGSNNPEITIVPSCPTAQSKDFYSAFGLAFPFKVVKTSTKIDIIYKYGNPLGNTKILAFSALPCTNDIKKFKESLSEEDTEDKNKVSSKDNNINLSTLKIETNIIFDNFFNPWINNALDGASADNLTQKKNKRGRIKGSRNKSTLEKEVAMLQKIFYCFDNFFDPWLSDSLDGASADNLAQRKNKRGRIKGSRNKSTLEKEAKMLQKIFCCFDNFFDPWLLDSLDGASSDKLSQKNSNQVGIKGSKNNLTHESELAIFQKSFFSFDNFFDPWLSDSLDGASSNKLSQQNNKRGRIKGSRNKSTLEKEAKMLQKSFFSFDNFFDPWLSDSLDGASSNKLSQQNNKRGRIKGSRNKSTLEKEAKMLQKSFFSFDNFFDPWLSDSLD